MWKKNQRGGQMINVTILKLMIYCEISRRTRYGSYDKLWYELHMQVSHFLGSWWVLILLSDCLTVSERMKRIETTSVPSFWGDQLFSVSFVTSGHTVLRMSLIAGNVISLQMSKKLHLSTIAADILINQTLFCSIYSHTYPHTHTHTYTCAHICPHRGGWQGAFQDSWWKPGVLWLLEGADSGDICASCCSAIVETLKVNYNINDSALQAVVPYYASIIPCMGTQRHREGIGPHYHLYKKATALWKGTVVERIVGL